MFSCDCIACDGWMVGLYDSFTFVICPALPGWSRWNGGEMLNKTLVAAFLLILSLPFLGVLSVSAEPEWLQLKIGDTFTVTSTQGFAVTAQDGKIARKTASLTFAAQITEVGEKWVKFQVTSGKVTVNGQTVTMTSVDGQARLAPRLKGAAITLHGSLTGGELRLSGRIHREDGKLIVGLGGWMALGSSLYPLRLRGTVGR